MSGFYERVSDVEMNQQAIGLASDIARALATDEADADQLLAAAQQDVAAAVFGLRERGMGLQQAGTKVTRLLFEEAASSPQTAHPLHLIESSRMAGLTGRDALVIENAVYELVLHGAFRDPHSLDAVINLAESRLGLSKR